MQPRVSSPRVSKGWRGVRRPSLTVGLLTHLPHMNHYPVRTVLEFLGAGDSVEDVLEEYPALGREDVLACLMTS